MTALKAAEAVHARYTAEAAELEEQLGDDLAYASRHKVTMGQDYWKPAHAARQRERAAWAIVEALRDA